MFNNFFNFNIVSNKLENIINEKSKDLINYIKKKKKLVWLLPYIKFSVKNYNYFIIIFLLILLIFSNFFIKSIFLFFLFDSIILAFLILHNKNIKYHARRLAKNIIAIMILHFNLTGSIITLLIVYSLYYEFNKFINKIIYKIIETFLCFIQSNISFISIIYPNVQLIDYDKQFESTDSESDSESDSNLLNDN